MAITSFMAGTAQTVLWPGTAPSGRAARIANASVRSAHFLTPKVRAASCMRTHAHKRLCGDAAVWLCSHVALWLCSHAAVWLCSHAAVWLCSHAAVVAVCVAMLQWWLCSHAAVVAV